MVHSLTRRFFMVLPGLIVLVLFAIAGCGRNSSPVSPGTCGPAELNSVESQSGELTCLTPETGTFKLLNPNKASEYIAGEVLVVLDDGVAAAGDLTGDMPLQVAGVTRCGWGSVFRLKITDGTPVPEMVERLQLEPSVKIAEPNGVYYPVEAPHFPNDPLWESDDPGTNPRDSHLDQWGPSMMGGDFVWNQMTGNNDVMVAVVDSGCKLDHEDLASNIWINSDEVPGNGIDDDLNGYIDDWRGWDAVDNDNEPEDINKTYHGTACAGVIAAVQDNSLGVTGIAPGVRLMIVKCIGYSSGTWSAITEAVDYAVNNGADIINLSLGGYTQSQVLEQAVLYAHQQGVLCIGAAGNDNLSKILYPAAYIPVMAVGASTPFDVSGNPVDEGRVCPDLGYNWGSNYGFLVDIAGFGAHYLTTDGAGPSSYRDGVNADLFAGTSCATPTVSGAMALLMSYYPGKDLDWYRLRIINTADDIGEHGSDIYHGHGRVNLIRALWGSDRLSDGDDFDFVQLYLPDARVYDSIHSVLGNPFRDKEDLYRFQVNSEELLYIKLDILTHGEDIDMEVFLDKEMTQPVGSSKLDNTGDMNWEKIVLDSVEPGEEYFLRVYSTEPGTSSSYCLNVYSTANSLDVVGENLAPPVLHQGGEDVPFLKLTMTAGHELTLDKLFISKEGNFSLDSLPRVSIYRDSNGNGQFDTGDDVVAEEPIPKLKAARFEDLWLNWTSDEPLILFVTADVGYSPDGAELRLSVESTDDVVTLDSVKAPGNQFPIHSDWVVIETDTEPPFWPSTTGAQTAEPFHTVVTVGWNKAEDLFTSDISYNIYYTDSLPFDINSAIKEENVPFEQGSSTDYQAEIWDLPIGEVYIVVRAEDEVGNEDDNLEIVSCTTNGGDPSNPVVLNSIDIGQANSLYIENDLLAIAGSEAGLKLYDISNHIFPDLVGTWTEDTVRSAILDGDTAYSLGNVSLSTIDISNPGSPVTADSHNYYGIDFVNLDGWIYSTYFLDMLYPFDCTDPWNICPAPGLSLPSEGTSMGMCLYNGYIYIAHQDTGILSINLEDPQFPAISGTFGSSDVRDVYCHDGRLYTMDNLTGFIDIYDVNIDPANPVHLGMISDGITQKTDSMVARGDYLFITQLTKGVSVFDVTDPDSSQLVGDVDIPGARHLVSDGIYIYCINISGELVVFI